ncbi:hypothetical protein ABEB36_006934 [Hypothenemus hampei]|uniref:Uncharacterized protein n=1 Tax=Hypothenemus hampei TaxID=57062 RepID=A0ABD1ES93_HYPHA
MSKTHRLNENIEVHCLEDACILVRVRADSDATKTKLKSASSDTILKEYAKQYDIFSQDSFESNDVLEHESKFTKYNSFNFEINKYNKRISESGSFDLNECRKFLDIISYAKELVRNIIEESKIQVESSRQPMEIVNEPEDNDDENLFITKNFENFNEISNVEVENFKINWPTIEMFNIETGALAIDEYLVSFDADQKWMYIIYFLGNKDTIASCLYIYQAIYSLPTCKYPISQATASVYFTIEVSKGKPPYCPVDVTYNYETFRQNHKPGVVDFSEKWLHYILDSKIKLFQTVTY